MKSVLNALQDGRLIELPDADKERSLQYLATIIEAVPDFRSGFDFAGAVLARERATNTAIGQGWACPHGRVAGDGDLVCALGWSPPGIDYGAADGKRVHILIMHCIPDTQKNSYLREISTVARAIQKNPALGELAQATELGEVRHRLIDLLTAALESAVPDAKARMIQLEAKQAVAAAMDSTLSADALAALDILSLSILVTPGTRPLVLSQDREAVTALESETDLAQPLAARAPFDRAGYRIVPRSASSFQPDRMLYECIAVKRPVQGRKG